MPGAGGGSPCAACKLLRRKCARDCVFAPYFTPDDPQKFAWVHKVFGASNELPVDQRRDAASSIIYEAKARIRDPVYGCLGAIASLQNQVVELRKQLALARDEIVWLRMQAVSRCAPQQISSSSTNRARDDQMLLRPEFSGLEVIDGLWSSQ